ncbi:cyclin-dependent kinase inhibitor 1-like [Crotalus tigris]|uniref:cyclin-dependent kinase inhibitor 1-like n=1 Tax=Crotalus tigris TaxID=88082 RepID=UPI00192F43B3|nr:cyclin-dependent kinase inhibitor 1-like [Crotalus tigris]XP_039210506.1 cyclin-dependent kinase inhibitor 1-like [Crotalus tigris]
MDLVLAKAAPIRRNLFGPVDHEHLQQEFQSLMRSSMEQAKQRWNFDFFQDVPVVGLLQWEELQGHEVPAFYHTHVAREPRPPLQPVNRTVDREGPVHPLDRETERFRSIKTATGAKKRRQTHLTDYYTTKKQIKTDMQTPVKKLSF